jgi:DNA-binding phage protein
MDLHHTTFPDPGPADPHEALSAVVDYEQLASELLRALRGKRSQVAFSRRLGRRSNVAYAWESGRRFPTAAEAMRAAALVGFDVDQALTRFAKVHAPFFEGGDPREPATMAALLRALAASTPTTEIAKRAERSRFAVSRWLSGTAEPRLPDFLRMLQSTARGALTFIACFVQPTKLPSAKTQWQRQQAADAVVRAHPHFLLLLVGLGLTSYRELTRHEPGFLARELGLTIEEEESGLEAMAKAELIRWNGRRWTIDADAEVDLRRDPEMRDEMRRWITRRSADAIGKSDEGLFQWVALSCSEEELVELQREARALYERVRSIATTDGAERAVVFNLQLFPTRVE